MSDRTCDDAMFDVGMFDAVLFDVDGTLVDSNYHHVLAWHRAFARNGVTVPAWRIHRTIGMGGDKLVGEVAGAQVEEEVGDAVRDAWEQEYAAVVEEIPALPGATELVRVLADRGYRIVLASSSKTQFSEVAVKTLGIGELVAATTSSDDAEDSKPAPDILSAALGRLDRVDRAVTVGDTPYDVQAAGRLGLRCIAVLSGGFSREELSAAGAALVVEELTELLDADWSVHLAAPTTRGART